MNLSWKNLTLPFSYSPETLQKHKLSACWEEQKQTGCPELWFSLSQSRTKAQPWLCQAASFSYWPSPQYLLLIFVLWFLFWERHANTCRVWWQMKTVHVDFWKATFSARVQLLPQHLGRGLNSKAVAVWAGVKRCFPASRNPKPRTPALIYKTTLLIMSFLMKTLVTAAPKARGDRNSEVGGQKLPSLTRSFPFLAGLVPAILPP